MEFKEYLIDQIRSHPSFQKQDVIKMCYQASFGAEHILSDEKKAYAFFMEEYRNTSAKEEKLYEPISDDFCRVNFSSWKRMRLEKEDLFELFVQSSVYKHDEDTMKNHLLEATSVIHLLSPTCDEKEWVQYIDEYISKGCPAVHHSEIYRKNEHPAYRIVSIKLMRDYLKKHGL